MTEPKFMDELGGFHQIPLLTADLVVIWGCIEGEVTKLDNLDLNWLFKKTQRLSELCQQEINTRREEDE